MPGPILAVSGPSNNSGKSTLIRRIIERAPERWQAAKVSTIYLDGNCPIDEQSGECACHTLRTDPWRLIDDETTLAKPGSDTDTMLAAGARPVLWGVARPGAHADLWARMCDGPLEADKALLTEGGEITRHLEPDALLVVVNPLTRKRWKDDAWELIERATLVVVNPWGPSAYRPEHESVAPLLERLDADKTVLYDVSGPLHPRVEGLADEVLGATAR